MTNNRAGLADGAIYIFEKKVLDPNLAIHAYSYGEAAAKFEKLNGRKPKKLVGLRIV